MLILFWIMDYSVLLYLIGEYNPLTKSSRYYKPPFGRSYNTLLVNTTLWVVLYNGSHVDAKHIFQIVEKRIRYFNHSRIYQDKHRR